MQLLITGGNSRLARAAMTALASSYSLRAVDTAFTDPLPEGVDSHAGDLHDPDFVASILAGVDTVLHLAPFGPYPPDPIIPIPFHGATNHETTFSPLPQHGRGAGGEGGLILSEAARGTYVLTRAAAGANVTRFIVGSTLDLFDRLPAHWKVTEAWRPRPEPRVEHLGPWLAELSVREIVRASPMRALCLRFGRLAEDADVYSRPYDSGWLHLEDAVEGIRCALAFEPEKERKSDWQVFHITGAGPHPKIRLAAAGRKPFGYRPAHDLWWESAAVNGVELPLQPGVGGEVWAATRAEFPPEPGVGEESGAQTTPRRSPESVAPQAGPAWRKILAPPQPMPSRPIRNVVVFGAGGPVAAVAAQELASAYTLRLTDVRPIAKIAAEGKPQSPGAPLPVPLGPPHDCRVVDIRDQEAVWAACEGMDAILDCSVLRADPVGAFQVNMLGAYNIVRAAVAHGIRRVVLTGPELSTQHEVAGYGWDYDIPSDAPARPGPGLYGHTKYLGQEICRVFADYHDLEVPVLRYCQFLPPDFTWRVHVFSVSWQDSARALRCALETPNLPSPFEVFNILADLPHGRFTNQKARTLLGWEPRDGLESGWSLGSE